MKKWNSLVKNGLWLYFLQFFNVIVPFLLVPYVVRSIGAFQYGVYSFALNIVGYFLVVVEYGFNLSGVRQVSIAQSHDEISHIYSRIATSKFCLLIASTAVYSIVLLVSHNSNDALVVGYVMFLVVAGGALQQTWLFQGLQRMKVISAIGITARLFTLIAVFLMVKGPEDLQLYSLLYALPFFISGLASILLAKRIIHVKYTRTGFSDVLMELKTGWHLFTTAAMSRIFTGVGVTVLAMLGSPENVGIYSALQKIPLLMSSAFLPISQVLFPYMSKQFAENSTRALRFLRRIAFAGLGILAVVSVLLVTFSREIVVVALGDEFASYHNLLLPLTIWLFTSIVNNILGIQILVASGRNKEYSRAFNTGVLAIVMLSFVFGFFWGMSGVAFATLLGEGVLTLLLGTEVWRIWKASK